MLRQCHVARPDAFRETELRAGRAAEDHLGLGQFVRGEIEDVHHPGFDLRMVRVIRRERDGVDIHTENNIEPCELEPERGAAGAAEEINNFHVAASAAIAAFASRIFARSRASRFSRLRFHPRA